MGMSGMPQLLGLPFGGLGGLNPLQGFMGLGGGMAQLQAFTMPMMQMAMAAQAAKQFGHVHGKNKHGS